MIEWEMSSTKTNLPNNENNFGDICCCNTINNNRTKHIKQLQIFDKEQGPTAAIFVAPHTHTHERIDTYFIKFTRKFISDTTTM